MKKCQYGCSKASYLGYRVNSKSITVDPDKVNSVLSFPSPSNVKELRSIFGMAG